MDDVRFLSDEWLAAADTALTELRIGGGPRWGVGYRVVGGPDGTTDHQLLFADGRVSACRGSVDASVTLTLDWQLAVAINQGEVSAQSAFLDGRIQLSGDPGVLLGHQHELTAADARLTSLRARTAYGPASKP